MTASRRRMNPQAGRAGGSAPQESETPQPGRSSRSMRSSCGIAAAACFLPLTVNPRLSRELGTRHRAAIGLTEENDAVAVVVSEETGTISIALDGQIERGLTQDTLRARLRRLIQGRRG